MDKILKLLSIGLVAIGGSIVIVGGIGGMVFCVVTDSLCTPIVSLTGLIGFFVTVSGLFPALLRFLCD